jgi:hypothetical protein
MLKEVKSCAATASMNYTVLDTCYSGPESAALQDKAAGTSFFSRLPCTLAFALALSRCWWLFPRLYYGHRAAAETPSDHQYVPWVVVAGKLCADNCPSFVKTVWCDPSAALLFAVVAFLAQLSSIFASSDRFSGDAAPLPRRSWESSWRGFATARTRCKTSLSSLVLTQRVGLVLLSRPKPPRVHATCTVLTS